MFQTHSGHWVRLKVEEELFYTPQDEPALQSAAQVPPCQQPPLMPPGMIWATAKEDAEAALKIPLEAAATTCATTGQRLAVNIRFVAVPQQGLLPNPSLPNLPRPCLDLSLASA